MKGIIQRINFCHVYGYLASLGWDSKANPLAFGDDTNEDLYYKYRFVPNIKIVNEDRGCTDSVFNVISEHIREADKVYILGFGFQDSNWKILQIDKYQTHRAKGLPWSSAKFYYTNHGLSKRRKEHIQKELFGLRSNRTDSASSYDVKIYDFMHHSYV